MKAIPQHSSGRSASILLCPVALMVSFAGAEAALARLHFDDSVDFLLNAFEPVPPSPFAVDEPAAGGDPAPANEPDPDAGHEAPTLTSGNALQPLYGLDLLDFFPLEPGRIWRYRGSLTGTVDGQGFHLGADFFIENAKRPTDGPDGAYTIEQTTHNRLGGRLGDKDNFFRTSDFRWRLSVTPEALMLHEMRFFSAPDFDSGRLVLAQPIPLLPRRIGYLRDSERTTLHQAVATTLNGSEVRLECVVKVDPARNPETICIELEISGHREVWTLRRGIGIIRIESEADRREGGRSAAYVYRADLQEISFEGDPKPVNYPWTESLAIPNTVWRWGGAFAWFSDLHFPWIYHEQLGWLYTGSADPKQLWLWSPSMGYLFLPNAIEAPLYVRADDPEAAPVADDSAGSFPALYSRQRGAWLWFDREGSTPEAVRFFDFTTAEWWEADPRW